MTKCYRSAFLPVSLVVAGAILSPAQESQKPSQNSPELAEASRLSQQVVTLYNQGKYDEAVPLAKRALEIRQKLLGSETKLVGDAATNLGSLYFAKKNYVEAIKVYERALKAYEKSLGDNDPKVADV